LFSTTDLHLVVGRYVAKHNVTILAHAPYSQELSPPDFFLVSIPKNCFQRPSFRERRGSHYKIDESIEGAIEK
jgi:hypothetical protein